jgi:hypothetical protein
MLEHRGIGVAIVDCLHKVLVAVVLGDFIRAGALAVASVLDGEEICVFVLGLDPRRLVILFDRFAINGAAEILDLLHRGFPVVVVVLRPSGINGVALFLEVWLCVNLEAIRTAALNERAAAV